MSFGKIQNSRSLGKFFVSWEMILVYILIFINIALMTIKPDLYFAAGTIQTIIKSGMDLSVMVLGMVFILILGEIDVSVGSIMIVGCAVTGLMYERGFGDVASVMGGIAAGAFCGAFNGTLTAKLKMPSVIVTIATSILFRGVVQIVLGVNTIKVFPKWFAYLSWNDLFGILPYSMLCFLICAAIFGIVLHKTKFGQELYIIGSNKVSARYSGLRERRIRIVAFTLMGVTAALSGILFAGRLGGVSSGMGSGYELRVIAIAVLGGVSTNGGRGNIFGPVIAVFIMAFLGKTLDLLGVHANVQKIITGVILLAAVVLPMIKDTILHNITKNKIKNGGKKND